MGDYLNIIPYNKEGPKIKKELNDDLKHLPKRHNNLTCLYQTIELQWVMTEVDTRYQPRTPTYACIPMHTYKHVYAYLPTYIYIKIYFLYYLSSTDVYLYWFRILDIVKNAYVHNNGVTDSCFTIFHVYVFIVWQYPFCPYLQ